MGSERRGRAVHGRVEVNPSGEEPTDRPRQKNAGLWEPYDGRLSRTVLREREGEVPSRHSPGLTQVRRDIQRRPEGSKPAFDPEVFRARFALLRRGDTLTDTDRARLDALLDAHPRLRAGWQALQELHGLYLAEDHQGALDALGRFCDLYETGELPEFHDVVDTIIAWSDQILAWHHAGRASNGRIEGTNTHNGWALPAGAGLTQAPTGLVSSG